MNEGPIRIFINDGREYLSQRSDEALVSDISAHVLYRSERDGQLWAMVLPLVTMSGVEPITN